MNILMLSEPLFPRHPGGAGKSTYILAAGLAAQGHRVRVLCQCVEATETEVLAGVEVHRLNLEDEDAPEELTERRTVDRIVKYLEDNVPLREIDVLYDSAGFLSFLHPVAYRLKRRYGFAFVVHYRYLLAQHLFGARRNGNPWNRMILAWDTHIHQSTQGFPCRFADAVICPATRDARFVDRTYLPEHQAFVLPEPVESVDADPSAVQALRAELVAPHEKLCLFAGRLSAPLKGARFVKHAFRKLKDRPDIRLLLLAKDHSELRVLKELLDRAIVRPWIIDEQELKTTLAAADVALMPSTYESFGLVCAEALSAGTPVIASQVGGVPDMVQHGHNGFLLDESDQRKWPRELAHWIRHVADNPSGHEQMREQARAAGEAFSIEHVVAKCERICETAIERNRQRDGAEVLPPRFSTEERERYLRILERFVGSESQRLGNAVLESWEKTASERCASCTRQRLATDTIRLYQLKPFRPRRILSKLQGRWPSAAQQAVEEACPLGLVQKAHFKEP